MRLIEFFPGEGSRFIVTAGVLPEKDARPIGGSDCTVIIGFGAEKHLLSGTFECTPESRKYLSMDYVSQYLPDLPDLDDASLIAAHHVIAALLGRVAIHPKQTPEALDWAKDWQDQLAPLHLEIHEGIARNGRGRFADGIQARFDAALDSNKDSVNDSAHTATTSVTSEDSHD